MKMQARFAAATLGLITLLGFCAANKMYAQTAKLSTTGISTIRGHVTDPDGAVIPNAALTLFTSSGKTVATAKGDGFGAFTLGPVPAGTYSIYVTVQGFSPQTKTGIVVTNGQILSVNFKLNIQTQQQNVEVTAEAGATLDVDPANNASSLVIKGKDLDALSDDPDELQNELTALAGPSAGPNGGQIYVDGFTAGQLPPKNAIREIRINQNPFSAQYDQLGYGRIEIFTKPGTDKLHGQFLANINQQALNTSNPFAPVQPAYDTLQWTGNVSGPINSKSSYFLSGSRRNIQSNGLINTEYVNYADPTLTINDIYTQAFGTPQRRTDLAPRYDLLVTPTNTLSVRYQFNENTQLNAGVSGSELPSTASNNLTLEDTLQVSDTQILGAKQNIVNEIHFQYLRDRNTDSPISLNPSINVSGGFSGGGSFYSHDAEDRYEFQDYTSIALNKNFIRLGGRLRINRDSSYSTLGFNGNFTFGPNEYDAANPSVSSTYCAANPNSCTSVPGIDVYAITLYNLSHGFAYNACGKYQTTDGYFGCGGPSEYSVTSGNPAVLANLKDAGLYAESDWKARPNVTLSYGLRFETQNYIHDKSDFAPRIALSWGLDGKGKVAPKTVIRAGFGLFYNRFSIGSIETAQREGLNSTNGLVSTTLINPTFSLNCDTGTCTPSGTGSTLNTERSYYSIQPDLHAATTGQSAVTVERQLAKLGTFTVNYLHSRGLHQYDTENLLDGPTVGGTPLGYYNNQFSSEGIFKENQILANLNLRPSKNISVTTFYSLSYAKSTSASPSNSYNLLADYGRANFDVRNRVFVIGNLTLPFRISLNPFIVYQSGAPFNITAGSDINQDGNFNDRPAYGTPGNCYTSNNVATEARIAQYGCFFIPAVGSVYTPIPINIGRGPNQITANLRISKSIGLGPKLNSAPTGQQGQGGPPQGGFGPGAGPGGGGGGSRGGGGGRGGGGYGGVNRVNDRKYTLGISVAARNIFNDVNLAPPGGTLVSPTFGESTQLSQGIFSAGTTDVRTINAQLTFAF